jgi:NAD(P)-dependent dehydrogenase (short-subunit alcohol dehydrogenase family)
VRLEQRFDLTNRVAVITGGAGLLGSEHGAAVAELGGIPVLVDLDTDHAVSAAERLAAEFDTDAVGVGADITSRPQMEKLLADLTERFGGVQILINNAARNPKMDAGSDGMHTSRLEHFPMEVWEGDIAVGLTGALICSQVFGGAMALRGGGVILNIASDLGLIAPDQRLYLLEGLAPEQQPVKPVTYSVVKHGLIGLTRYMATYWAKQNVRVNALAPGGIQTTHDAEFVAKLRRLIPMDRMAQRDEYRGAVAFLVSDASSYMTGAVLSVDGGRTCW